MFRHPPLKVVLAIIFQGHISKISESDSRTEELD
jgi:hypothetical protein